MVKSTELYNVPKGAAYLTSQQAILYLTYLVFYVFLARILNTTEVGLVGVLALVQALFIGIASGSLPSAATRFISRSVAAGDLQAASGVAKTTLKLSVAAGLPLLLVGGLLSTFLGGFLKGGADATSLLLVTFAAAFVLDLTQLYTAFFLGIGRYAQTLYQNIFYVPLSRGLGLVLAYFGFRVLGIVAGWAIGGLATLFLSLYLWRGNLPKGGSYPLRPILAFSVPVFAGALITLGQQWGDIGIIYALLGPSIEGPYYVIVSSVSFLSALWIPVNQAIYPALSASHSTGETKAVSERLALAFRLVNLAVLPIGAALAAITPTALEIVYGATYVNQDLTLSILALASVFTAQAALLITTLQAVGRIRQYLGVTLASTLLYFAIVGLGALPIGVLAGALARAILAVSIVILARRSLHHSLSTHTTAAMSKAIPLAAGVSLPLLLVDQLFLLYYHPVWLRPIFQLAILSVMFVVSFAVLSRQLRVFHHGDFAMLRDVLPRRFQPYLRFIQGLIISDTK